ncbi:hypothetical protein D0X99_16475 [Algoriphagus lacus]|uniref:Uncharacterized protein n=1 Tax=Algoriphagus lacus TaxID=2056311 RepID=A0A418PNE8_9BACT|nr:hypothetical protein [Algoriphagus lacus]RIW13369.1 hypothetical protein D0X99_16475 [Algoriphagus lacus]
MRNYLFLVFFAFSVSSSHAQVVGEFFATENYMNHEVWWSKPFADSSRFSFFSFNRFRINFENSANSQFLNYSTVNYTLGKNLGISGGGFLTQYGFAPLIALNYFYLSEKCLIGLFPGIQVQDSPNADLFAFIQFRPKVNDKIGVFIQLIASSNFNFKRHNVSEQSLRIGLDYRSFQFGYGLDLGQYTYSEGVNTSTEWIDAHGLFIRKEF